MEKRKMYIKQENPKEYTAKNVHNLLVSIGQENALHIIDQLLHIIIHISF